jgi:hypothetical protein
MGGIFFAAQACHRSVTGHNLSFVVQGNVTLEWLQYSGTRRTHYAHNSSFAVIGPIAGQGSLQFGTVGL